MDEQGKKPYRTSHLKTQTKYLVYLWHQSRRTRWSHGLVSNSTGILLITKHFILPSNCTPHPQRSTGAIPRTIRHISNDSIHVTITVDLQCQASIASFPGDRLQGDEKHRDNDEKTELGEKEEEDGETLELAGWRRRGNHGKDCTPLVLSKTL